MINIDELLNKARKSEDEAKYLKNFFKLKNLPKYELPKGIKIKQKRAILHLFSPNDTLENKCDKVLEIDPFCFEAFYCFYVLNENPVLQMRFNAYYDNLSNYPTFDEYQACNYIDILDLYAEFLTVINNFTKAIVVGKTVAMLMKEYTQKNITRLAFAYSVIEDDREFYRLYQNSEFNAFAYILLIITLLKHDDEKKAEEVLLDMYEKIEYSTYLDHCWDLDESDSKQKELSEIVTGLSEQIEAVPLFYSFVNKTREKYGK